MFRLHRLSCSPHFFDPVEFKEGVNLILGERSDKGPQGKKVNGVGKSLCVEFLHFALLRSFSDTRVSRIPREILPEDFQVELDLSVGTQRMTIIRRLASPNEPTITTPVGTQTFAKLEDATQYLGELLFAAHPFAGQISFRQLLSLLMRDESSGFQDFLDPHSPKRNIPVDITPHLYLLGIDLRPYQNLRQTIERLKEQRKVIAVLKKSLTDNNSIKIQDVPLKLNAEREAAQKIEQALATLKADPAFESVEADIVAIETELHRLRAHRKALGYQISEIQSIPLPERIDAPDLKIVFERIEAGLGELVEKSLDQAIDFKSEIEKLQHSLQQDEIQRLESERERCRVDIERLSARHAQLVRDIDTEGALGELKTGLEVANQRTRDYHRLEAQYREYEELQEASSDLKAKRVNDLQEVRHLLSASKAVEQSMNATVVAFHQRIMNSSDALFQFQLNDRTTVDRPLKFDLRIQDDGSGSINRDRVFIYDMALLFDPLARRQHPGFLVHDGILEVDQDTLTKCLNFIHQQMEDAPAFQYILTLNKDRIDNPEQRAEIDLDLEEAKRATFTKESQFLKTRYQEL